MSFLFNITVPLLTRFFESTAKGLVDKLFREHKERALSLVQIPYKKWGDSDAIEIASTANLLVLNILSCLFTVLKVKLRTSPRYYLCSFYVFFN